MNYKIYWDKQNPAFLILHWWGGSSDSWEQVAKMLAKDFFVIVPDIPCASVLQVNSEKWIVKSEKNMEWWRNDGERWKQANKSHAELVSVSKEKDSEINSEWHSWEWQFSNSIQKSISIPCNKVYTLDDYADLVKNLIDELELKNFVLLWHSNGGAIATKLVTKYPDLPVKKLILNNSAWIRKDKKRSLKRKIFGIVSKIVKPVFSLPWMWKIRNLFYKAIWGQDYLEAEKNPNKKQTFLNMINEDLQELFQKIQVDTLLIWWENDTYTPLSDWKKINNFVKNSKIVIIKNVRHGIHLQNPKKLVEVILDNI